MCGIAGILNLDGRPASESEIQPMIDAIAHRGPDDEGIFVDGPCGLGHRRLAILDPTPAGHQPMETTDGQLVLTYNGEVYNFRELRRELELLGRTFLSRTDTEVVLQALAQWGTAAVDRFNGMFALAVWDRQTQRLLLVRDRYGIKPLYYVQCGTTWLFASEIKAILAHPAYRVDLDREALLEYFTFQNLFTDRTLFKNIRLLPPGTRLLLDARSGVAEQQRYWDFHFVEPDQPASDEQYAGELAELFSQAVERHLVSDVPLGSYLSGGMDSGSITALAARHLPYVRTFTCGFDLRSASGLEASFDERELAEYMSYLFKTEHYELVLKAGDMERVLPELVWYLEDLRVGQSYPNYYVAQLASKFVKVVLAGIGGDELFGGYPWRYYRAVVNSDFEEYVDHYYQYWHRLIPNRLLQQVFAPIWNDVKHVWTRDIFRGVFAEHAERLTRPEDYVNHSLYFEAKTFLHGLLLVDDKLSMAHGLETRVPYLDNDLVQLAMRLPVRLKLANLTQVVHMNENEPGRKKVRYFQRHRDGKLLVRRVMRRWLPEEVVEGEKQGFSAPDASWFKGDSIQYVRRVLYSSKSPIYEFFDRQAVTGLLEEHMQGQKNRRLLIWSLLCFHHWLQRFLGMAGSTADLPPGRPARSPSDPRRG